MLRCSASTCADLYRRMLTYNISDSHSHQSREANAGSLPKVESAGFRARTRHFQVIVANIADSSRDDSVIWWLCNGRVSTWQLWLQRLEQRLGTVGS